MHGHVINYLQERNFMDTYTSFCIDLENMVKSDKMTWEQAFAELKKFYVKTGKLLDKAIDNLTLVTGLVDKKKEVL